MENYNHRAYAPNNFKKIIEEMNPILKGIQNNPINLIKYILETIHNELNNAEKNIFKNNNYFLNNNEFNYALNVFHTNFINKNKSIISEEFYGFINSITKCTLCQTENYKFQSFNILFSL